MRPLLILVCLMALLSFCCRIGNRLQRRIEHAPIWRVMEARA